MENIRVSESFAHVPVTELSFHGRTKTSSSSVTRDKRLIICRNALFCVRRADIAQLVEQLIRNQQVRGSSPLVGLFILLPAKFFPWRSIQPLLSVVAN